MIEMPSQTKETQQKRPETGFYIYENLKQQMLNLFLIDIMIILFVSYVKKKKILQ